MKFSLFRSLVLFTLLSWLTIGQSKLVKQEVLQHWPAPLSSLVFIISQSEWRRYRVSQRDDWHHIPEEYFDTFSPPFAKPSLYLNWILKQNSTEHFSPLDCLHCRLWGCNDKNIRRTRRLLQRAARPASNNFHIVRVLLMNINTIRAASRATHNTISQYDLYQTRWCTVQRLTFWWREVSLCSVGSPPPACQLAGWADKTSSCLPLTSPTQNKLMGPSKNFMHNIISTKISFVLLEWISFRGENFGCFSND